MQVRVPLIELVEILVSTSSASGDYKLNQRHYSNGNGSGFIVTAATAAVIRRR